MSDESIYRPLPMPHGRVRPPPPPLLVEEGTLPPELVEQARARYAAAEILVLPREAEAHLQNGDPSLAIYNDSDMVDVEILRRGGVSVDYLAEHRKVVSQFAAAEWIDFAVLVSAGITVETVVALARGLAGRIRKARESRAELKVDLTHGKPDGTYSRAIGTDTDAALRAFYASLATSAADPAARDVLLHLAAGVDPATALTAPKSQAAAADTEGEAGDQHDTHEGR
jgi:hypothetical protein